MDQEKRRSHRESFVSGVFANEAVALIGMARGVVLSLAVTSLVHTTAADDEERETALAEFLELRAAYGDYLAAFLTEIEELPKPPAQALQSVKSFSKQLDFLGADAEKLARRNAVQLAHQARREVIPAVSTIIRHFQSLEFERRKARDDELRERTSILRKTFAEMDRIDRMIRLVSINASVEAARAGGEAGRTFQVIAEEVRALAQRSAEMLLQVKDKTRFDAPLPEPARRRPSELSPPATPRTPDPASSGAASIGGASEAL